MFEMSEHQIKRSIVQRSTNSLVDQLLSLLNEASEEMNPLSPGWRGFLHAVFWMNAFVMTPHVKGRSIFGAFAQQSLTRSLLRLSIEGRKQVSQVPDEWSELWKIAWIQNYLGSMSVAKTAKALEELGIRAILPTTSVDRFHKIDLLGHLPGEHKSLLCLQVKTGKGQTLTWADSKHLTSSLPFSYQKDPSYKITRRNVWNGMEAFANRYRLNCACAIIHVGTYHLAPLWSYEVGKRSLLDALTAVAYLR
jgi:hypothetical protein